MVGSLFASAALTVLSAVLPGWHSLIFPPFFVAGAIAFAALAAVFTTFALLAAV